MNEPYVVSGDIGGLLADWALATGFSPPSAAYLENQRTEFSLFMNGIFPTFEFVPEKELREGIALLVAGCGLPAVSLDRAYFPTAWPLDLTRAVDADGRDRGLVRRPASPPLLRQFRDLAAAGLGEVVLVDDVLFSGSLLVRVIRDLGRLGLRVRVVCIGVGVGCGLGRLRSDGIEVRCLREYSAVIDEICERDFYPGVPFSGRLLFGSADVGRPYLRPFGDPGRWASVPDPWVRPFSEFCLRQTVDLFGEIGRISGRPVRCVDLGRPVFSLPQDDTSFVEALRRL